jgi:hypothetical protein
VTIEIDTIAEHNSFTGAQFYADERTKFEASNKALSQALAVYKKDLETQKKALETRKNNLFQPVSLKAPAHDAEEIGKHVAAINALIDISNGKTSTLERDKTAARDALRLADVFTFAEAISYDKELGRIAALKIDAETAGTTHTDGEKEIREAEAEVQTLRAKQKDERKGAERVNSLLTNFFGHDGIKLEARDGEDKVTVKFEVTRDGKAAYNLSEGSAALSPSAISWRSLTTQRAKERT